VAAVAPRGAETAIAEATSTIAQHRPNHRLVPQFDATVTAQPFLA
jgi:hypothetical protein